MENKTKTMKYDLGKWVKEARKNAGYSQEKLALALEFSGKATVSAWEQNKNAPPFETMVQISHICGFPLPYIGLPTVSDAIANDRPAEGYLRFSLIDVNAAAGEGVFNTDFPEVIKVFDLSEEWVRRKIGRNIDKIKLITANGDSMLPTFADGDLLFVDTSVKEWRDEGVYIFFTPSGLKVKRLHVTYDGELQIISDNKLHYATETVSGTKLENIVICGKVKAALTLHSI